MEFSINSLHSSPWFLRLLGLVPFAEIIESDTFEGVDVVFF